MNKLKEDKRKLTKLLICCCHKMSNQIFKLFQMKYFLLIFHLNTLKIMLQFNLENDLTPRLKFCHPFDFSVPTVRVSFWALKSASVSGLVFCLGEQSLFRPCTHSHTHSHTHPYTHTQVCLRRIST